MNKHEEETTIVTVKHPDYDKELVLIGLLLTEMRNEDPSVLRWIKSIDSEVLKKYVIDHERSYVKFIEEESDELEKLSDDEVVWQQDMTACSLYLETLRRGEDAIVVDEDSDEPLEWLASTKFILRLEHEVRKQRELGELLNATKITDTEMQMAFNSMVTMSKSEKLLIFKDKRDYRSAAIDGLFGKMLESVYDDKNIYKYDRVMKSIVSCLSGGLSKEEKASSYE